MSETEVALVDQDGNELAEATTDEEGFYEFEGAYPEAVTVQCDHLEDNLERGFHIQVFDGKNAQPVVNAEVKFTEYGEPRTANTDGDGVLKVTELTDTYYTLSLGRHRFVVETFLEEELDDLEVPHRCWINEPTPDLERESLDFDAEGEEDDEVEIDPEAYHDFDEEDDDG
jgi:hypothetical protein